ncbi:minor capsid protein [Clostridiales Family XIII bacterium BX16]|uniref:Minor capsid protein n=1 Tax=Lentihominibacter faecis TaxID=2764712 RepID=A0A923NC72_9FIRM|nr:minor capsid protein [Lentihominibacter faecis]MBC5999007.1 minor capsid protein [Lentihominibacter faecis]
MATNSEYWKKRERENLRKNLKSEAEYAKEIQQTYNFAMDQIQKEIDSFYAKYAKDEGITIAQAKKRASKLDMEEYSRKAKKYVKEKNFSKQANEEMKLYNLTMKVNRLELLKASIGLELVSAFDELQQFYEQILTDRTLDEFERQAGILGSSVPDNAAVMAATIVNASFHNAKYSERIWMHQDLLRNELGKLLTRGMVQGKNPRALARELRKTFDVSIYNSERLMRTELARVQTEAQLQSYKENGFEEYEYMACHNRDVCANCKALDGKIFKIDDGMPGENAPPMHPSCHCATTAHMDLNAYEKWLDGYSEHGMSFKEWQENKNDARTKKRGIINKAKVNTVFTYSSLPANSDIRAESIFDELDKTRIGKRAIQYMDEKGLHFELSYRPEPSGDRAYSQGDFMKLHVLNNANERYAAAAVVHELTHHYYDTGGCQRAEVLCYMNELKQMRNIDSLTISDMRYVIGVVKEAYGEFEWRKGGYFNGKPY